MKRKILHTQIILLTQINLLKAHISMMPTVLMTQKIFLRQNILLTLHILLTQIQEISLAKNILLHRKYFGQKIEFYIFSFLAVTV